MQFVVGHTQRTTDWFVLGGYVLLWSVLTFPLVLHLSSAILGEQNSDAPLFLWNAWEMLQQWTQGELSWMTYDMVYPFGVSLLFHTYTPINAVVIAFSTLVVQNWYLAFNLFFAGASVASAFAMYKWVMLLWGERWSAFFAGAFFAFQPLWSVYVNSGTQNLLTLWFLPVTFLCVELYRTRKHWRYAVYAGATLGLAGMNDVYPFLFTAVGLGLYIFFRVVLRTLPFKKAVYALSITYGVCCVVLLPKFIGLLNNRWVFSAGSHPSLSDVDYYHADIVNMLRPYVAHPLFGSWSHLWTAESTANGNAFIGTFLIGLLIIVLVWCVRKRKSISWSREQSVFALCALSAMVLSAGPFLHVFGFATGVPLPSSIAYRVFAPLTEIRVPLRWLFLVFFFLAPLVSSIMRDTIAQMHALPRRVLFLLCIGLFVFDVGYVPRPLLQLTSAEEAVYATIAEDDTLGTVVDIPLSVSSGMFHIGEPQQQLSLLYQTVHGKPIVTGHGSRLPRIVEEAYRTDPVLQYLVSFPSGGVEAPQSAEDIAAFLTTYQPLYIVVHIESISTDRFVELDWYIREELGFVRMSDNQTIRLYRRSRP